MQQGQTQFGGTLTARDAVTQQPVQIRFFGTVTYQVNADPAQYAEYVGKAVSNAAESLVGTKLAQNQLAIPTLSHSAPALAPEIAQAAQAAMQGISVQHLDLQFQPPPAPAAPAGPPMQMPPTPMEAMQNSLAQQAKDRLDPSNYEVKAKLNIGGFKLGVSSEDGVDTDGLKKQAVDKAKSKLIGCVITAVILFIVLVCLAGLAWYIYAKVKADTAGSGAPTAVAAKPDSALKDAGWDGSKPFSCGAGDAYKISGVTAKLTSGTAISAGSTCTLLIENSNIDAPIGVSTGGNANVTIRGGSITGRTQSLKALGNSKISVEGGAKITGKTMKLGKNAVIEGAE